MKTSMNQLDEREKFLLSREFVEIGPQKWQEVAGYLNMSPVRIRADARSSGGNCESTFVQSAAMECKEVAAFCTALERCNMNAAATFLRELAAGREPVRGGAAAAAVRDAAPTAMAPTGAMHTDEQWWDRAFAYFLQNFKYGPKMDERDALVHQMRLAFNAGKSRVDLLTAAATLGSTFDASALSRTYDDGRQFLDSLCYLTVRQVTAALLEMGSTAFVADIEALLMSERAANIGVNVDTATARTELTQFLTEQLALYGVDDVGAIVEKLVANNFGTKQRVQMLAATGMWDKSGCDPFEQVALTAAFQRDNRQQQQ